MRGRLGVVVTSRSCRVVYIAFFWVAAAAIGVWTSQCGMLRGATGRANSAGLSVTRKSRNALGWEVYKYPSIFSQIAISKVVLYHPLSSTLPNIQTTIPTVSKQLLRFTAQPSTCLPGMSSPMKTPLQSLPLCHNRFQWIV